MRRVHVDAVLVQAVIAAALSFAHLHDIAGAAGQDGWKAWAYPVSVDLLLVAAWHRLRTGDTKALAWCWFLIALAASLGANVATAGFLDLGNAPAWLRMLVAGWPALAFLGGTLLAHSSTHKEPESNSVPAPVPASASDGPAVVTVERPPELAPAPQPSPAEAPDAPPALVAHARKVAAAHQTATGHPIDPDTLCARLGVPAALAAAVAAEL